MDLLLDTSALLWWLDKSERLGQRARDAIVDPGNRVYVSVVSAWEIVIKLGVGKLSLPPDVAAWLPERLYASRFTPLPVDLHHTLEVERLPGHHNDPFDRLLIAQATLETLTIVTGDPQIRR